MNWRALREFLEVVSWLVFPLVPVLLAQTCYQFLNMGDGDPRAWDAGNWLIALGPLWGFGFLAGATAGVSDVPGRRRLWAWLTRRSVWVGVGPWVGFLFWASITYGLSGAEWLAERLFGPSNESESVSFWTGWKGEFLLWTILVTMAYGWLIVAVAAVRRARRAGQFWGAVRLGLLTALVFVGSLVGSFWTATQVCRSYFFDPTIVKTVIVAVLCLTIFTGCGPTTLGEMRRRELFDAMLTAWVLGLALSWRWWGRPRRKPPIS
ncbi:MAG TPA: hypothetical protein VGZ22_12890 [Isosphaeraceae bacterium]|jgi:hypothetical protein|nr:hypothetical protein [Isosphaeraceae bacterium]